MIKMEEQTCCLQAIAPQVVSLLMNLNDVCYVLIWINMLLTLQHSVVQAKRILAFLVILPNLWRLQSLKDYALSHQLLKPICNRQ